MVKAASNSVTYTIKHGLALDCVSPTARSRQSF